LLQYITFYPIAVWESRLLEQNAFKPTLNVVRLDIDLRDRGKLFHNNAALQLAHVATKRQQYFSLQILCVMAIHLAMLSWALIFSFYSINHVNNFVKHRK
jgi:hypothetical protein